MVSRERELLPRKAFEGGYGMNNNCFGNLFGDNNCCWIIIIALIVLCCCCN